MWQLSPWIVVNQNWDSDYIKYKGNIQICFQGFNVTKHYKLSYM